MTCRKLIQTHYISPTKMIIKEDQTAPVGLQAVSDAISSNSRAAKQEMVQILLDLLNEKRDAYNGIASSMIYMISSEDVELIELLKQNLLEILTRHPMKYGAKMFIQKVLFRLTQERAHFVAGMFEQLIKTKDTWGMSIEDKEQVLRLQIIALKAIRQAEHVEMKTITTLTPDEIKQLCDKAMSSCDDSTKIDTLSLILQSRSTTKILDQYELDVFKMAFQDALGLQEPSLRQAFLAITNKLLERLKGGLRLAMRDKLKFTDEQRELIKARYTSFLTWLIDFCLDSIYCNAYFGSFILTMSTLKLVIQHVTFADKHLHIGPLFSSRRCYDSILSCLNDSFEENKLLALELLFLIPENEELLKEINLEQFEKIAYYLVNSVNPAHSLTCQYVFRLLIGLGCKRKDQVVSKSDLLHHHLCKLLTLVEDGVQETRDNLIVALKNNAIYPKLTCIRALLGEIDVNKLEEADREQWATLASRIVAASIEACHAVSTVVCNLNPETIGHLPMDLKPVSVEALSKSLNVSLNITEDQLATISSQMLLISGWKTIKECSLSMGTMCTCFWWPKERLRGKREKYPGLEMEPILSSSDINQILGFFDHYLRNLRHRGAFEQAYNGFQMVTRRIWHDEQFREQLKATLSEIMSDFRSETDSSDKKVEYLKAYVTRRSAGLPFIVQAILNSEDKQDSKTLRWVMDCLFEILNSETSETYQKIHCLNILRALIKESCLGEKVIPYIGETLAITMDSFRSDSFPIRNCANMLLKATVDRTFGVNRLRDDIHRRNKLSFEKFFQECPNVHGQMLKHLQDGLRDRKCLASVHSVMIILFRLKPSLTPADTERIVRPFVGPILELAFTCADFKLREVAAKLAVQLEVYCAEHAMDVHFESFKKFIDTIEGYLFDSGSEKDLNRCHGALSLVKHWVLRMRLNDNFRRHISHLKSFVRKITVKFWPPNMWADSRSRLTISLFVLELVESYSLVWPDDNDGHEHEVYLVRLMMHLYCSIDTLAPLACLVYDTHDNKPEAVEPHFEAVGFKLISILLMSSSAAFGVLREVLDVDYDPLDDVLEWLIKIVLLPANKVISVDLQASIVRLLRQLIDHDDDPQDYLSKLMEHLDLDSTATHVTPFDRLHQQSDNDFEQERWAKYCQRPHKVRQYLRRRLCEQRVADYLFNLGRYDEFRPQTTSPDSSTQDNDCKFSPKLSNTPRSIELLALACKMPNNHRLCNYSSMFMSVSSVAEKINYFNQFIGSLPDCDIKCLALLYSVDLFTSQIKSMNWTAVQQGEADVMSILSSYTRLLEELADGHHSYIIRETCGQVLSKCLQVVIPLQLEGKNLLQGDLLMNLLSTLIKLCQDEEHSIRQCSFRILAKLRDETTTKTIVGGVSCASRMSNLITLLTTRLLSPNSPDDVRYCFELSMRIIFAHTKNFSTTSNEEREILFDKSKLNTFADHVATIRSALEGLSLFFGRQSGAEGTKIDINTLQFSPDVLRELEAAYEPGSSSSARDGDYNWRLKKSFQDNNNRLQRDETKEQSNDNNLIVHRVLQNILASLDYFSNGYWNMLTDTDYPYHELSIFKKIAFVRFILQCTEYKLKDSHLVIREIKTKLSTTVRESSSTTMLSKCLDLLE